MSAYNEIQLNGVCWYCGEEAAPEVDYRDDNVEGIGWRCKCGRWWPVGRHDMENWVVAYCEWHGIIRGEIRIQLPSQELVKIKIKPE